jgi:N-methylhydantoinase A
MAPDRFLGGRMVIHPAKAEAALAPIAVALKTDAKQAALGVVRVANAIMERALRNVSLERGFDPRDFTLVPFGGAGPQHACELALALGMRSVLVPLHPGVLSALGVAIADISKGYSRTVMLGGPIDMSFLESTFTELEARALADMTNEGFDPSALVYERSLDIRYHGQSFELGVPWTPEATREAIAAGFHAAHAARFGYADEHASLEIVNVRLQAVIRSERPDLPVEEVRPGKPPPTGRIGLWLEDGPHDAPIYERDMLHAGAVFAGPALVTQMDATTVVPPGWRVEVDLYGNLLLSMET